MALALATDIYIGGATEKQRKMESERDCGSLGQMMRLKVNLSPLQSSGLPSQSCDNIKSALAFLHEGKKAKKGRES